MLRFHRSNQRHHKKPSAESCGRLFVVPFLSCVPDKFCMSVADCVERRYLGHVLCALMYRYAEPQARACLQSDMKDERRKNTTPKRNIHMRPAAHCF